MRRELGEHTETAVDANQAWSPDEAGPASLALTPYSPTWLEEPVLADYNVDDRRHVANTSPIRLAADENMYGEGAFDRAIRQGVLEVIQPDVAKWMRRDLPLAFRLPRGSSPPGKHYYPHYLGVVSA